MKPMWIFIAMSIGTMAHAGPGDIGSVGRGTPKADKSITSLPDQADAKWTVVKSFTVKNHVGGEGEDVLIKQGSNLMIDYKSENEESCVFFTCEKKYKSYRIFQADNGVASYQKSIDKAEEKETEANGIYKLIRVERGQTENQNFDMIFDLTVFYKIGPSRTEVRECSEAVYCNALGEHCTYAQGQQVVRLHDKYRIRIGKERLVSLKGELLAYKNWKEIADEEYKEEEIEKEGECKFKINRN